MSTYTYDAEGNRTSKTDIATGSKVEYPWNHANLLTGVIYKTSNNVVTKSVAYQYDALGRRIGKSVDDNGNGTVDRRESYIYDGAGLLSSFSPTGGEGGRRPDEGASAIQISGPNGSLGQHGWTDQMVLSFVDADGDGSGTSQLSGRYLYGPAVDEIFAVENGTGDVLWALTDQLGTPRDWAQRTTTGNTVIAQHIRYAAFGAIDSITDGAGNPPAASSSLLTSFTGQLTDPDAGLIYYRARWYDPQLGKFISDDPMGFAAGDVNVSRYVGNRSSISIDITGLQDPPEIYSPTYPVFVDNPPPPFLNPNYSNPVDVSDVFKNIGKDWADQYKDELIDVTANWAPEHPLLSGVGVLVGAGAGVAAIDQGFIKEIPLPTITLPVFEIPDWGTLELSTQGAYNLGDSPWDLEDDTWILKPGLGIRLDDGPDSRLSPVLQGTVINFNPQLTGPLNELDPAGGVQITIPSGPIQKRKRPFPEKRLSR